MLFSLDNTDLVLAKVMEEGGSKEAVSTAHSTQTELKASIQPIYHLEILYMMNHLAVLYPPAPVP